MVKPTSVKVLRPAEAAQIRKDVAAKKAAIDSEWAASKLAAERSYKNATAAAKAKELARLAQIEEDKKDEAVFYKHLNPHMNEN